MIHIETINVGIYSLLFYLVEFHKLEHHRKQINVLSLFLFQSGSR